MHLSMLSPEGGGGGVCPKGGDFDRTTYSQGGEFDLATILDNEEGLEINLVPKDFSCPGSEGKALETRLSENNSAILKNTRKALK